jgi:hypothetical protein
MRNSGRRLLSVKCVPSTKLFLIPEKYFPTRKRHPHGFPHLRYHSWNIFLQFHEKTHLNQLLDEKSIVFYARYVDDIFIIYSTDRTTPEKIHNYVSKLHPNLEFTPTLEDYNRISFLGLLITRQPTTTEIDICRKPTTTNTTINFTSNHPTEHKLAAYRYLINRMIFLPLSPEKEKKQNGRQHSQ